MTSISNCPCCGARAFSEYISCKDFTVSHETFQIQKCQKCALLATNPRPDDNQIGKYYESSSYISHTNKSASIIDSLYLIARKFSLKQKYRIVSEGQNKTKHILDYGCGTGEFIKYCKEKGWAVSGVEPSTNARQKAEALTGQALLQNILSLPEKESFDVITLWHVLEHVSELHPLLETLKTKLKRTGTIFVAVPNHNSHDAQFYKNNWAAYDVPRHLWHFGIRNVQTITESKNLRVIKILPMKLDSYYVSMLSEKYISGKSTIPGILSAAWRGLISNIKAAKNGEYSSLIYVIKHAD